MDACKDAVLYETGVTAAYGDKLITLSTCDDSGRNSRVVVVAKRITEPRCTDYNAGSYSCDTILLRKEK